MEYPPGAAPMFVLPASGVIARGSIEGASWAPLNDAARRYYRGFTYLVLVLLGAIVILTALTLAAMRRSARMVLLSLAVVASSPWLIGQALTERFDVWPAALTAAALAAAVRGRFRLGGALLGLGAAAKFYPLLLVPVLALVVIKRRSVREAGIVAGTSVAVAAAVFLPFAIVSASGMWESLRLQFRSGLQIETLASSLLVMASHVAGKLTALGLPEPPVFTTRFGEGGLIRRDLAGSGVGETKIVTSVLLAAALCLLFVSLYRSRHETREELLRYAAAAVAVVLVLGTVLSPQYVVWLLPLVVLVGGRRGAAAMVFFVMAAGLTNFWYPDRYEEYEGGLPAKPTAVLLARNLALVATAVSLLLPARAVPRRLRP